MRILIIFLVINILFFNNDINAQNSGEGSLEGRITSIEGQGLSNVNIAVQGTSYGTSTDQQGQFNLSGIPAGQQTIKISRIGYQTIKKPVKISAGQTTSITVSMTQVAMDLKQVVLSGGPIPKAPIESTGDVNLITGVNKFQTQSAGIGASVEQTPGVRAVATGPQTSKPVIRGLRGKRVRLLHNNIGTDYQQYGVRHMPNMDPFLADRLEVVQGPASVLYGSSAMGGAINYMTKDVAELAEGPDQLRGSVMSSYATNNDGWNNGLTLEGAKGNWGFEAKVIQRLGDNITTGEASTFAATGEEGDPKFTGRLNHTDFEQLNGSASVGYNGDFGKVEVNYTRWQNEHNFLLPNGKGLGQRLTNNIIQGQADFELNDENTLRTTFSYISNQRQSAKGGTTRSDMADLDERAHLDILRELYSGRASLQHQEVGPLEGQVGLEVRSTDQTTQGVNEPLVPSADLLNIGAFIYEEAQYGQFTFSLGGRFDYEEQEAQANQELNLPQPGDGQGALDNSYESIAGSFGVNYRVMDELALIANLGRGFRAPSLFDLHADGQHGGVAAYQRGRPNLEAESNLNTDFSVRWQSERLRAKATFYRNWIDDYVFLTRVPGEKGPDGKLPLFETTQGDATITGGYASIAWDFLDNLTLKGSAELVEGDNDGEPKDVDELPLMPANELSGKLKYRQSQVGPITGFYLSAGVRHATQKDAAGRYEPFSQFDFAKPFGSASTDAYTLLDASIGGHIPFQGRRIHFSVQARNLTDEAYRNFLDTYKGYALSPGRDIRFKLKIPFQVFKSE